MDAKRRFKKRYIITIALIIIIQYVSSYIGGYTLSESLVIRNSIPNINGKVVFEKEFNGNKVIVWETDTVNYIKLIERNWGIFYRVTNTSGMHALTSDEKMKITWSATNDKNDFYKTLFGTEVLDKDIVKVIVSNHDRHKNITSLSEAKEKSTVYIEMDVENGYAAHYSYLKNAYVGGYTFRGLNSQGEIISIY
ncbi:hypothetical protein [Chengkuizengella sediminis]|uniref:hypothetical protein n=1 Tax=Chengkuizengella sediminis TaxID=1885917 RepID=UPI001389AC16|nr:hypothetical protein [Chengkuizengella sediminis]NDI35475.1 hypothetical protein [Chengkuizengella sediminis]